MEHSMQVSSTEFSDELINELAVAASSVRDPGNFTALFSRAMTALNLDHITAFELLRAAPDTIDRWLSGKNIPHGVTQPAIFAALHRAAVERCL